MPTLSSSIVKQQVASMRDVEEALARQVLYGGDLATNLLELAAVSEAQLTRLLAESHGLEAGPDGELPRAQESTLRLVPGDLALRHGLYPLEEHDGTLAVAVSDPLPPEVEQDLGFALGVTIEQRAAPLVRIRQAISRDYELPLDRRTLRLLAKLEGRPDPSPSSMPGRLRDSAEIPSLPRPPALPAADVTKEATAAAERAAPAAEEPAPHTPRSAGAPAAEQTPSPTAPSPAPQAATDASPTSMRLAGWAQAAARPERRRRVRRRGPYTAAMAERDLLDAESRDDVLRAFFDYAAQYFEYAVLFAVHGDIAEGRDANGPGTNRKRITGIGVPLDLPSSLTTARVERAYQLQSLADEGIDAGLASDLGRKTGPIVLLLPIIVRGRCVLILYGDHGDTNVELSEVGDVIAFAPLVASALERIIMRRKLAARQNVASELGGEPAATPLVPPAARRKKHAPKPSLDERAQALAQALSLPAEPPGPALATPSPAPAPASAPPSAPAPGSVQPSRTVAVGDMPAGPQRKQTERGLASPVIPVGNARRLPTPPQGTPTRLESDRPTPVAAAFPLTRRSTPSPRHPEAEEPPEDGWEVSSDSAPSAFPAEEAATKPGVGSFPPRRAPTSPGMGFDPGLAPPSTRREGSSPKLELVPETVLDEEGDTGPSIQISESELDEDIEVDKKSKHPPEAPLAAASRSVSFGARRLAPRRSSEELKLPSVIVDVDDDCRELVSRLVKGDAEAGDSLVAIGEPAVSALVAAFPGPITTDPRRGDAPVRASDCGPVLRTLARIGHAAVPFLFVRTADASPDVRSWATRLLGELPSVESARAVVRRLVDQDPDVHRAALSAGRRLSKDEDSRTALRDGLCQLTADSEQSDDVRHAAIEALADLREARAVPRMIPLLSDGNADVVKSAHWALGVIARQDFGREPGGWQSWWQRHSDEHRIEWLIDALMHDDPDIRRAAGEELKSLTKEYFGYYDDLPKKERARAQRRYREWWEGRGKVRFLGG